MGVPVHSVGDDPWVRCDVSDWELAGVEQAGSSSASWLREPGTEFKWLHKNTTTPASTGVEQGEDWAEVVASHTALLLRVPRAETRLCTRKGRRGSLSLDVRLPSGFDLNEGRVVLEAANLPDYFPTSEGLPGRDPERPAVNRPGHNLVNIRHVLAEVAAPEGFQGPSDATGYDVFAGYLILDAVIANRDRHEQNWAVLTPQLLGQTARLAPSYDHGGSLGYNLPDNQRSRLTRNQSALESWASRGTAHRFEHRGKPQSLVSLAAHAAALCTEQGAQWWRDQVASADLRDVHGRLAQGVSGMSDAAATFASMLLDLNLRRLQDAICSGS